MEPISTDPELSLSSDLTWESGGLVVPRERMRFDFGGAKFRLPRDQRLLGWIFDQFLYGEVTGIQCGHWLYRAPTLDAASFFARQAVEELSHVRLFLKLYRHLGLRPAPAHPLVRLLATGSMGKSYAEHVATEMAIGEGLVLMIFYALIDTIEDPAIVKLLSSAARQEERHVAFGEQQTKALVKERPHLGPYLLGLNLITLLAIRRLAGFIGRSFDREHEVLRHLPSFLRELTLVLEERLNRLGILHGSLDDLGAVQKAWLIARAYLRRAVIGAWRNPRPLTRTYLDDPLLKDV